MTRKANPDKKIQHELTISRIDPESQEIPYVVADKLLDEVFINLYSNAVKYTDGSDISIETALEEKKNEERGWPKSWKISIADSGRGIRDSEKQDVFTRYQKTARGSGLGLSIAYALVVDRYRGKIRLISRVREDYSRGTVAEVHLREAE